MLIAALAGAFAWQVSLGRALPGLVIDVGFVPAELTGALEVGAFGGVPAAVRAALLSTFLHAGWAHVAGNLLYLRVFGEAVEDRLGHLGVLLLFLGAALAGAVARWALEPLASTPALGGSAAVAGLVGAQAALRPRAPVLTLFPVVIVLTFVEAPAFLFVGVHAAQQLASDAFALETGPVDAVAWSSHLGGLALGLVVGVVARRRR